jgi:hypothetical protein
MALGVLGVGLLAVAGITASKMGGVIGMGGDYDMPTGQVKTFVQSAANRRGWTMSLPRPGTLSRLGEERLDFTVPLLPWMNASVSARLSVVGSGSHVEISGHSASVKALKADLDGRLPTLSAAPLP